MGSSRNAVISAMGLFSEFGKTARRSCRLQYHLLQGEGARSEQELPRLAKPCLHQHGCTGGSGKKPIAFVQLLTVQITVEHSHRLIDLLATSSIQCQTVISKSFLHNEMNSMYRCETI